MGENRYSNGFIRDNELGQNLILNGPGVQSALHALGEEFISVAVSLFEATEKGEDTAPTFYTESFDIKEVHRGLVEAIQIYNEDPTAEWVEFGAHAGGKTRVLRYRILGRTADVMHSRSAL